MRTIIVVLDSASILNASIPLQISFDVYIPQGVIQELNSFQGQQKWLVFKEMNRVREEFVPEEEIQRRLKGLSKKLLERLSHIDKEVLTLARRLSSSKFLPVILTDDYALQKASMFFQIPCQGVMFPHIKEQQRLNERLHVGSIIQKEM